MHGAPTVIAWHCLKFPFYLKQPFIAEENLPKYRGPYLCSRGKIPDDQSKVEPMPPQQDDPSDTVDASPKQALPTEDEEGMHYFSNIFVEYISWI